MRRVPLIVAAIAAAAVLGLLALSSPADRERPATAAGADPAAATPAAAPPIVTVLPSRATTARPEVRARGEVRARFRTVLSAEIAGALVSISRQAHSGRRVTEGTALMTLDDSRYRGAVASARADLEKARLLVEEEDLRARQAIADWGRIDASGDPSRFLLREPQKRSAQLAVEAAQAALLEAEKNLARTVIRAPFDAAVVRRLAPLGSYVQPGTELIELDSSERVELRLPLTPADWALLPPEGELLAQRWPVELSTGGREPRRWRGRVSRIERHVVTETRQRALVVTVPNPLEQDPPLYPGTFVRATLLGRELAEVLDLPAHVVTEQGEIWFVDGEGLLAKTAVDARPGADGRVLVTAPAELQGDALEVVAHPMASYLPGLPVQKEVADAHP
ncbi:MAG: efflux RND transporter periplasmic adaptor subunit [Acidobacteriota bacterium]